VRLSILLMLVALQGCLTDSSIPTRARITVDGPTAAAGTPVRLVSSSELQADRGDATNVLLIRADTAELTVPFTHDLEIRSHAGERKLYVEVAGVDGRSAAVRLRVTIQDTNWYDRTLDLSEMFHRFLFVQGR
jgi:hypothetical protein